MKARPSRTGTKGNNIYSHPMNTRHYTHHHPLSNMSFQSPAILDSTSDRHPLCPAASPEYLETGASVPTSGICSSAGGGMRVPSSAAFHTHPVESLSSGHALPLGTSPSPGILVIWASPSSGHLRDSFFSSYGHFLLGIHWASLPLGISVLWESPSSRHSSQESSGRLFILGISILW